MGPVGAAMGAFRRINRGMEHNAHSIFKRRPNLRHKDHGPLKPGKRFRARSLRLKKNEWRNADTPCATFPLILSGFGVFLGMIILVVGLPAALPLPTHIVKGGPISGLAAVLIFGLTILCASMTGLIISCLSRYRAMKAGCCTK